MKTIHEAVNRKGHLKVIESNVFDIPQRLKDYDKNLFIVYNLKKDRFEIHSLENPFDSYCISIPYKELDERTLTLVRRGDMKTRGMSFINSVIREEEKRIEREEKEKREFLRDFAKEYRTLFSKAKDEMGV